MPGSNWRRWPLVRPRSASLWGWTMNGSNDSPMRSSNSSSATLDRLSGAVLRERAKRNPDNLLYWSEAFRNIGGSSMLVPPALHAIYKEDHPFVVVRKPSQVGATEFNLNTAAWAADGGYAGRGVVLYLLPTQEMAGRISQTRVSTAIPGA